MDIIFIMDRVFDGRRWNPVKTLKTGKLGFTLYCGILHYLTMEDLQIVIDRVK